MTRSNWEIDWDRYPCRLEQFAGRVTRRLCLSALGRLLLVLSLPVFAPAFLFAWLFVAWPLEGIRWILLGDRK